MNWFAKGPIIWGYYYSGIVCACLRHCINNEKEKTVHKSLGLTALESAVYALTHFWKTESQDKMPSWDSLAIHFSTFVEKAI